MSSTFIDDGVEASSGPMWVRIFGPYLVDQLLWGKTDPCGSCGTYYGGFAHLDFLGSQVMITKDTVEADGGYLIYETYRYGEYGQPYFYDGNGDTTTGVSQIGLDHLYTGRRWDPDLGIYFYRARYYEQTSGRFLSRDPLRDMILPNSYAYVRSDPVANTDPFGLQAWVPVVDTVIATGMMQQDGESGIEIVFALLGMIDAGIQAHYEVAKRGFDPHGTGRGNALLHCVWLCLMARDPGVGARNARHIGNAHEAGGAARNPPETPENKAMDDSNNRVGLECAGYNNSTCIKCCMYKDDMLVYAGHGLGGYVGPFPTSGSGGSMLVGVDDLEIGTAIIIEAVLDKSEWVRNRDQVKIK